MAEKQYPSERQERFIVRLPDGMRDKIKSAAGDRRSMNDIVVEALEQYFRLQDEREAGWRWMPPEHQVDPTLLKALESIAQHEGVAVKILLDAAVNDAITGHEQMEIEASLTKAMSQHDDDEGATVNFVPPGRVFLGATNRGAQAPVLAKLSEADLQALKDTIAATVAQELARRLGGTR